MYRSALAPLRCGVVVITFAMLAMLAGCTWSSPEPAPVIQGDSMGGSFPAPIAIAPSRPDRRIVVRPGQSLRGIAHAYHVTPGQLVAANHLRPPYELKTGQRLLIPGGGGFAGAPIRTAALPPLTMIPAGPSSAPLTVPPLAAAPAPMAASRSPNVIPLDDPGPPRQLAPPLAASPAAVQARPPATLTPPQTPMATARPLGEPSAAAEAKAEANAAPAAAPTHGGRFGWPVRGHVLAGYGVASGGTRNDGINIAAPRGAPVAAVDGGEVAYAGNELKGYGNLVLIKHPSGYITAYAHCEELLVKRGDKVSRGQVIAKVGTTGGVNEPQLHFELRRGKQPVDPKEFLAPAPSAWIGETQRQG